jgi:hypothetical protein
MIARHVLYHLRHASSLIFVLDTSKISYHGFFPEWSDSLLSGLLQNLITSEFWIKLHFICLKIAKSLLLKTI